MSYSIKFRRRVLKIRSLEGLSFSEAAARFGVSRQSVYNWSRRLEEKKKRNKPSTKIDTEALKRDIELYPDSYQYERAARFGVTQTGIFHALKRLKVTYQKKPELSPGGKPRKAICILPESN